MNNSILVIDDEPNNFEVIETLLSIDNYDVYYASNGEDALASLDTFNPDVILLDLMMPVMDGLEVCNRLKLMRKWKSIPIIMVTASAGKKVLADCLAAGADDFIHKPVDGIELRARVKSMLRIKKQFDRIEALTKLQQQNILGLEHDLGELGCDLVVGFANELNTPLNSILERLKNLEQTINKRNRAEILDSIKIVNRSALELEQLTYKFWIYLELSLERKQFDNQETCDIKQIVEQMSIVQSQSSHREKDLKIAIQNATVTVTEQHFEWIFQELLDSAFKSSEPGLAVKIHGRIIDRSYHLWISDRQNEAIECQELIIGLKIVKKIVDIYEGSFARTIVGEDRMIQISLPLAGMPVLTQ